MYKYSIIACAFFIIAMGAIVISDVISTQHDEKSDIEAYNNGVCVECDGKMEFYQGFGDGSGRRYIYKCNECGHCIEVHSMQ